jgi:hypothetical protein
VTPGSSRIAAAHERRRLLLLLLFVDPGIKQMLPSLMPLLRQLHNVLLTLPLLNQQQL